MRSAWRVAMLSIAACASPPESTVDSAPRPMEVGERRTLTLRALELNVKGFRRRLTLDELRAVPRAVLDQVWLLDLDLRAFVMNTLTRLAATPAETLPSQAARNLQRLLDMNANNIDLAGTSLESLVAVSRAIGIAPQDAVADLFQMPLASTPVIPLDLAAEVLLRDLVGTHPFAQTRLGADGVQVPVNPGSIPITLGDVVDNFVGLTARFGPALLPDGRMHPGFIEAARGFAVVDERFALTVKVDGNGLPYKGVDLSLGEVASVSSIGRQIETLFPLDDPDWLQVEGLVDVPVISSVTFTLREHPTFLPGGNDRLPRPLGNSPVWGVEPWLFEPMIAQMAVRFAERLQADCVRYTLGVGTEVYTACLDDEGWLSFETFNDVGAPPPPAYIWDMMLEMAQVRLHDGGLVEGQADASLTVTDLPLGVTADALVASIRANVAANPAALRELAEATNPMTRGAADLFYQRDEATGVDWLRFVEPGDLPRGPDGARVRPYAYAAPGFFRDPALTIRAEGSGESDALSIRVAPGETYFVADDLGGVYALEIEGKEAPSRLRIGLSRQR